MQAAAAPQRSCIDSSAYDTVRARGVNGAYLDFKLSSTELTWRVDPPAGDRVLRLPEWDSISLLDASTGYYIVLWCYAI